MIPLFKPAYNTEKILAEMARIFETGWTGLGHECIAFEQALARRLQSEYGVFLNSATAALHLAVECLQLPAGSRIAVPDITFVSTATAAMYAGHVPVLLPVDDNIQLDLDALEKVVEDIDAVIVVHYSGNCCDMDRLVALCNAHRLPLIEDCAHAMGSIYKGRALGTFGELGCFSFHSVKNLPIADGGLVVGHRRHQEPLRSLRWLGIDKPTYERVGQTYSHSYDVTRLGYKCHGNDLMAVVGLANLELLDAHNARRKAIHDRYVAELDWLQFPRIEGHTQSAHHLVECCMDDRDSFIQYMAEGGVTIGVHYRPISSLSFYAQYATPAVRERSDRLFRRLATLPCYPDLTADQQGYIIELMNQFHEGRRAAAPQVSQSSPLVAPAGAPGLVDTGPTGTTVLMTEVEYQHFVEQSGWTNPNLVAITKTPAGLSARARYGNGLPLRGKLLSYVIDGDETNGYVLVADWNGNGDLTDETPIRFEHEDGKPTIRVQRERDGLEAYPVSMTLILDWVVPPTKTEKQLALKTYSDAYGPGDAAGELEAAP